MTRDLTARGPFPALVLPSVSFIPDAPAAAAPKALELGQQPHAPKAASASEEKK